MDSKTKDFKEGLKTTSLFGGVQIFRILIQITSTKFVAVLLGPTGVGISGLLGATTSIITSATNLGLGTSTIRELSSSYANNNHVKFYKTVAICRKLVWFTGLAGMIICLFFSPIWSKLSFGDYSYTWSFAILSITLLLGQVSVGQNVILQGTRNFKYMAKAGIAGSILGLFTSIPLYFFLRVDGIVPAMIVSSILGVFLTHYFSRKVPVQKVYVTLRDAFKEGRVMVIMGFLVALQSFLNLLCAYIVRVYISNIGSIEEVGLYNSGFAIINTYVGMVFTAMSTDYYPRLSAHADIYEDFKSAIDQQMELAFILLSPMIILFLVFNDIVISLLYSTKFLSCSLMVCWGILGIFLKAPSWCLGYIFLAKGDTKAFFWNELAAQVVMLVLNLLFFRIWGLNGLGVSFVVGYFIYLIQVVIVSKYRYRYIVNSQILRMTAPYCIIALTIFAVILFSSAFLKYIIGIPLTLISFYLSYTNLNSKINIKQYVISKLRNK